jgi:hypothetical protein
MRTGGQCQVRNLCTRGCPFGVYFSSVSSTLPWAQKTGNLTIRPFSVVHSIIYDEQKRRATGVRVTDKYYYGRNPTNPIIANYCNLHKQDTDYLGGFLTFVYSNLEPAFKQGGEGIGGAYKDNMAEPGPWQAGMFMQGETLPKETNHVRLSKDQKDPWGIPQLITSVDYDDNDEKMIRDFSDQMVGILLTVSLLWIGIDASKKVALSS